MSSPDWNAIQELAERALELAPEERRAWIHGECSDEGLRLEVLALLDDAERSADFLEPMSRPAPDELAPTRIGPFRLLHQLAVGGMASVYLAEQARPRRQVAIKILSLGFATPAARRRFEYEAEILAGLRHPGIAAVHASGTQSIGGRELPWIALEHIEGARSLTQYAREAELDQRARLELVRAVCDAVQYSHSRGVIHRDLKPANLLVDLHGRVKLIDFGIARAGEELAREDSFVTRAGEVLGTLRYMAPEQLRGNPEEVDARCDVYALGVVLYELLCGRGPHELEGKSLTEIAQLVSHTRPERPSRHASGIARDLEWIALHALEPERERRYASAAELDADLARFLRREPVLAGPPSRAHELALFVRRHRGASAAGALLLLSLVAFTVHLVRSNRELAQKTDDAQRSQAEAEHAAYAAEISAVELAIRSGEAELALRKLEGIAPAQRGWEWRHFHARLSARGHLRSVINGEVWSVAIHPDGELAAVGESSNRVHLLDLAGDSASVDLPGVSGTAYGLDFDPAGARLAGAFRGTIVVWDVRTRESAIRIETDGRIVHDVDYHPSGAWFATAGGDGRVRLWDSAAGDLLGELETRHATMARAVEISPDGRFLAASSADQNVYLFDAESRELLHVLPTSKRSIWPGRWPVHFSPDSSRLAASPRDGLLRIWEVESGTRVEIGALEPGRFNDFAYTPSGEHLVGVTDSGALCAFDLERWSIAAVQWGHDSSPLALALSEDGAHVVTGGKDNRLVTWSTAELLAQADALTHHDRRVFDLALSFDGRLLASNSGWRIEVHDLESGELHVEIPLDPQGQQTISLAFHPDGGRLLTMDRPGVLREWSLESGELLREREQPATVAPGLAVSERGWILIDDGKQTFTLLDAESWEELASYEAPGGRRPRYVLDATGTRATVTSGIPDLVTLRLPELEPVPSPPPRRAYPRSQAPHPDGERLAVWYSDGAFVVWETGSDEPLLTFGGPTETVRQCAYTADGSRLAAITVGGMLYLYDAEEGTLLFSTRAHGSAGSDLLFAQGDRALVTCGDEAVRLWRAPLDGGG